MDSESRRAIVLRICVSGASWKSAPAGHLLLRRHGGVALRFARRARDRRRTRALARLADDLLGRRPAAARALGARLRGRCADDAVRRGLGGRRRRRAAADERVDVLVLRRDHAEQLPDGRRLALGEEPLAQHAVGARDELHHGLVGLDLGEHVARLHGVALVPDPLHEAPLLHGGGEGLHHDFGSHRRWGMGTGLGSRGSGLDWPLGRHPGAREPRAPTPDPHSMYMTFFTAAIVFAASGLAERSSVLA